MVGAGTKLKPSSGLTCCPPTYTFYLAQHHPQAWVSIPGGSVHNCLGTSVIKMGPEMEGHTHVIFPNQEAGAICHSRSNSEPASRPVIVHWNLGHPPWCRQPRAPIAVWRPPSLLLLQLETGKDAVPSLSAWGVYLHPAPEPKDAPLERVPILPTQRQTLTTFTHLLEAKF